jgi:outer membrane protein assembly factor BamB
MTGATRLWLHEGPEIVGVVDGIAYYWDAEMSDAGGIVGLSVLDGQRISAREIHGSNINGSPRSWLAGPGGFVTGWDLPLLVTQSPGAQLEVRWRAPGGHWSAPIVVGNMLVAWNYEPRQAVVALSLETGAELWQAPVEREANGLELGFDGESIVVTWQQYSATAPTPTVTIPKRIRTLDPSTGATRWTQDFDEAPGGVTVVGDTLVVAEGADLSFLDGRTRAPIRVVATGHHPTIYPSFASFSSTLYVALVDAVTAYDATSGEVLWRDAIELDGGPELVLVDDLLLVSTGTSLVALDRETGRRAWAVGLGIKIYRLLTDDASVVAVGYGGAVGFALPARFEVEQATLSGRVELRCVEDRAVTVLVGSERVHANPDGRYQATVTMAGIVRVTVVVADGKIEEPRPIPFPVELVELEGTGRYEVPTLVVDRCDDVR